MSVWEVVAIFLAGVAAGTINTIVGSGSLITFPTLLAFGFPPVGANISNNIGMVFGGVSGTWGYRAELAGQGRRIRVLAPASLVGSVTGALLLLRLPGLGVQGDRAGAHRHRAWCSSSCSRGCSRRWPGVGSGS